MIRLFKTIQKTLLRKGNTTNHLFSTFGENLLAVAGIPEDIKDKILQPFFTTKKGTQGTGLGLSITHDIVKAHGGSLDVHSHPGQTVFTIKLIG